jgi:hypothetical protein
VLPRSLWVIPDSSCSERVEGSGRQAEPRFSFEATRFS